MPDPSLLILILLPILLIWWMSRSAKKQQQRAADMRNTALQEGNEVETIGGYIGTVELVEGETVTLRNAFGELSEWSVRAIRGEFVRHDAEPAADAEVETDPSEEPATYGQAIDEQAEAAAASRADNAADSSADRFEDPLGDDPLFTDHSDDLDDSDKA